MPSVATSAFKQSPNETTGVDLGITALGRLDLRWIRASKSSAVSFKTWLCAFSLYPELAAVSLELGGEGAVILG